MDSDGPQVGRDHLSDASEWILQRPFHAEAFGERHGRSPIRDAVEDIPGHDQDRNARCFTGRLDDATDDLALIGGRVDEPLTGDRKVHGGEVAIQACLGGDDIETRRELGTQNRKATGESSRRARVGQLVDVDAEVVPVHRRGGLHAPLEQAHLRVGRAFLLCEPGGCVPESDRDITRRDDFDAGQTSWVDDRSNCAEPAVGRRGAAQTDDDPLGPGLGRGEQQLPGSGGVRDQGFVPVRSTHQCEARRRSHFDHRDPMRQAPRRADGTAEGIVDLGHPVRTTENLEQALPAVREGDLDTFPACLPGRLTDRRGDLCRGRGSTELVGSGQDSHGDKSARFAADLSSEVMDERPIVVVSNRGPVSFHRDPSGALVPRRGAGGLVSGLSPLLERPGRLWVAAALSADDRAAIGSQGARASSTGTVHGQVEVDGIRTVLAGIDAEDLATSYDKVCNETLWYVHHHLFDAARHPVFDRAWFDAWGAYRRVNAAFADVVASVAPPDGVVLIQDYHLYLMAKELCRQRSDVVTVHFSHTPFAEPAHFAMLPDAVRHEILEGLAAHRACGFHSTTWRDAFDSCCAADGVEAPSTFVAPLGSDADDLEATTQSDAFAAATRELDAAIGDRRCIARSDRIELSKNLIRGFLAFDLLLETHPDLRGEVVFAASVYPSREANPDYIAYREQTEACVDAINRRWATPGWTPILLDTSDDYPRSVATLARADVVLVNPLRDGLNLVACEAMIVNQRDALLALSPQAGVWSVLGDAATAVHPYDIVQTAEVLHRLLVTASTERAAGAARLRNLARVRTPSDWLADQLSAAG